MLIRLYELNNTFGQNVNEYFVSGEFSSKIEKENTIKNVTDGKFRLIFQEYKNENALKKDSSAFTTSIPTANVFIVIDKL
jgi:hypothetical protein